MPPPQAEFAVPKPTIEGPGLGNLREKPAAAEGLTHRAPPSQPPLPGGRGGFYVTSWRLAESGSDPRGPSCGGGPRQQCQVRDHELVSEAPPAGPVEPKARDATCPASLRVPAPALPALPALPSPILRPEQGQTGPGSRVALGAFLRCSDGTHREVGLEVPCLSRFLTPNVPRNRSRLLPAA